MCGGIAGRRIRLGEGPIRQDQDAYPGGRGGQEIASSHVKHGGSQSF
jgi:hypothetical protein